MPVAILSLRFSPLLDSCFIKREPWLPWKHLPERVNWQCTRVSTLSEFCQYERYLLQSVMTLFNMMLGVICPRECFSASLALCSYEQCISGLLIVTGKFVQKRICSATLFETGETLSRQTGLSGEAQTGRLSASRGTGSKADSHFMAFSWKPILLSQPICFPLNIRREWWHSSLREAFHPLLLPVIIFVFTPPFPAYFLNKPGDFRVLQSMAPQHGLC